MLKHGTLEQLYLLPTPKTKHEIQHHRATTAKLFHVCHVTLQNEHRKKAGQQHVYTLISHTVVETG